MRNLRSFRVLLALVNAAALASCQKPRPTMPADEFRMAQRLSGPWDLTLTLLTSPVIAFDTAHTPRELSGKLELLVNNSLNEDFSGVGIPTNYGSYDLDLTPFGFDPRIPGTPPTAVVGIKSRDSIAIVLSPGSDRASMVLTGRVADGTVSGTWHVSLTRSNGNGLFFLKRAAPQYSR